jgi:uncharacterized membrane protein YqjE
MSNQDAGAERVRPQVATPPDPLEGLSLGELVARMSSDTSTLFRQELELAKVEMKEEVAKSAKGAAGFGGAALMAMIGLLLLAFAAAWGLAELIPVGFAFLTVAVVFLLIAGVLAVTGRWEFQKITGPKQTTETLKEDVQWTRERMT